MARLFILFLIALLPLRGWAAERMVLQMQHGTPAVTLQQSVDAASAADCAQHMPVATAGTGTDADAGPAIAQGVAHSGCQFCQLCMPLAALDAAVVLPVTPTPQAAPVLQASPFVSADTARHAKPPIS